MKNLPNAFVTRMKKLLGKEYADFEKALNGTPVRAFRVNTDKLSVEEFEKINSFSTEKIPFVKNGYYFEYDKIGLHPYHHAGMIYVQEPAAMAPAECVDIKPDWHIVDMCAAPGGKSTQLKNKIPNGVLVSNEIIPSRCKILTGNIERLGLKNTVTTCMDTGLLANIFEGKFDLVMCDAPCSGEGMFRKDDTAINEWSEENVKMCAERQAEILDNAARLTKGGGYIVYATCTFSLEENEMTVDAFLSRHKNFELCPVAPIIAENTENGICFDGCKTENIHYCRRFYPHKNKGEGQFMAVLKNTDEPSTDYTSPQKPKKIDKTVIEFLNDTLNSYDLSNVTLNGDTPVYFTPEFDTKNAKVFSKGVTIGEIRKNYILPHHQFFMAMGNNFKRKIELAADSDNLKKYLQGEEIAVQAENGWAAVLVDGCTLGGAKIVNGTAKNHYPKGLRLGFRG
ncbi:MAG: RNA methyltransferase [Ruminococcaceae bacterium]|nr:RNA methyltransferase [Oscillospiraceae bacterium]